MTITTITNLYKQVFNNKYLNRIIYNYVRFGYEENSEDYVKSYDQIANSYSAVDLEIGVLLRKKQYKLLGTMIDNYFKYVSNNQHSHRYWYYTINPTKFEIIQLMKWRELGFDRFKLLYDEFTLIFEINKSKLMKHVCTGGNFQIFQFLLDKGYPLVIEYHYHDYLKAIEEFNCGGNIQIFKYILNQIALNFTPNPLYFIKYIVKRIHESYVNGNGNIDWISVSPSTTFQFYGIYKYLVETFVKESNQEIISVLYEHRYEDLSLGRVIIEIINSDNTSQFKYTITTKLGMVVHEIVSNKLILSPGEYNVLAYMFNNNRTNDNVVDCKFEDLIVFHSKSLVEQNKNIYIVNVDCIGIDFEVLFLKFLGCSSYFPNSIQEFNFIIGNEKLKSKLSKINKFDYIIHVGNKICDLEYLKLLFQFYYSDEITNSDKEYFKIYQYKLLESTFEIVSWVFEEINNQQKGEPLVKTIPYNSKYYLNLFHCDIRIYKAIHSKLDNNFGLIRPRTFRNLIIKSGHYDMFVYMVENEQFSNHLMRYTATHNQFQMFKYLLDYSRYDTALDTDLENSIKHKWYGNLFHNFSNNPLFLAYYLKSKDAQIKPSLPTNNTRDYLLKSIYLESSTWRGKLNGGVLSNSTKVLDYLISNNNVKLFKMFNKKCTLSYFIRYQTKKFIYLFNKFHQDGIDIGFIIKESISTNNYLILNYIINLKSSNGDNGIFKNQFYLYFLLYSILLVNRKNNGKFNSVGNSLISNQVQLYNYYSTISDTDKFNLDFSNLIYFKDQFESQLLYLDNLSIHIKRNEYKTSKSLYNLVVNNLNLFITQQQRQHSNNNFVNFLINLKHSLK